MFENPEFTTTLSFDENSKTSSDRTPLEAEKPIFVLGDSMAMGWGVNDNETYSYWLERHLRIPVYNLGISSYGTVREISRGITHPQFDASRCVIIFYHPNDKEENDTFLINGALPAPTKARFEKLQSYQPKHASLSLVARKTFNYLKEYPYELFWFAGDWKWHIYKMIPLLRERTKNDGDKEPVEAASLRAEIQSSSHAEVFLKVLEAFPELRTKFVMVLGPNGFVDDLLDHSSRPRNLLPLKLNNTGYGAYYPLDTHFNSARHRNVAFSILEAFKRDRRFSKGCGIDVDDSHRAE